MTRRRIALPFLLLVASAAGCQPTRVATPLLTADAGGNDPDQQLAFFHGMADRPVTSNDEAFHALLLFADGADPAEDYAGRVAEMKRRKMLPAGFDRPADEGASRGTIAVALVRALSIRGGAVMSLLGPSPRYATKELEFLNLYPPSSPNQTFSGGELLGIISKVEAYQQTRTTTAQAERVERMREMEKGPPAGAGSPPPDTAPTTQPEVPVVPREPLE